MTARAWTVAELDQVWPWSDERKAEGWSWELRPNPTAVCKDYDGDAGRGNWHVWIDECGSVCSVFHYYARREPDVYDPYIDVAAAVIGAHLGHDSPEWMAAKMDERARGLAALVTDGDGSIGEIRMSGIAEGQAPEAARAAAMLRRGRVDRATTAVSAGTIDRKDSGEPEVETP